MGETMKFDYYYGLEAEQFSFYRIPRLLIRDEHFRDMTNDAKLLYGLMLDRMGISMKNDWQDEDGRTFIIYSVDAVVEDINCARDKAMKVMNELISIGLIEKVRRGQGKPDIIYVKNFAGYEESGMKGKEPKYAEVEESDFLKSEKPTSESRENRLLNIGETDFLKSEKSTSESRENRLLNIGKTDFLKSEKSTSESRKSRPLEVGKTDPNYTNNNYTENNYNNLIYPSEQLKGQEADDGSDGMEQVNAYRELVRENLRYDYHMQGNEITDKKLLTDCFELICDIVCFPRKAIRINKADYPYAVVKSRFLKLTDDDVSYVIDKFNDTPTDKDNIRGYLLTALYNAPDTVSSHYSSMVNHDMYGGGWIEKGII